jgi:hypothetical protein
MKIAALIVIFTTAGCISAASQPGKCQPYLNALSAKDPAAEAEQVVRSKNPHLLAIQGFSFSFPGVDDQETPVRMGYRVMEGTTDAIWDESCRIYQRRATRYAEIFNRRVMELMPRQ